MPSVGRCARPGEALAGGARLGAIRVGFPKDEAELLPRLLGPAHRGQETPQVQPGVESRRIGGDSAAERFERAGGVARTVAVST